MGGLKSGTVVCPLFPAFGPEPIGTRPALGEGRALVTTEVLLARRVACIVSELPAVRHEMFVGASGRRTTVAGTPMAAGTAPHPRSSLHARREGRHGPRVPGGNAHRGRGHSTPAGGIDGSVDGGGAAHFLERHLQRALHRIANTGRLHPREQRVEFGRELSMLPASAAASRR